MTELGALVWVALDPFGAGRDFGHVLFYVLLAVGLVLASVWLWRRRRR